MPEQLAISFVRLVTLVTREVSIRCAVCFHMSFQRAFILHAYTTNMTRVPKYTWHMNTINFTNLFFFSSLIITQSNLNCSPVWFFQEVYSPRNTPLHQNVMKKERLLHDFTFLNSFSEKQQ